MKKPLLTACLSLGLSFFPSLVPAATYYWDGGATNGLWCDNVNWGQNNPLDPDFNVQPNAADTILFTVNSPPGDVQFTCDTSVNRVRLTSATVPRTLRIGTNEVVDRTLTLAGGAAELMDQFSTGVGRDLIFSGEPNDGGFRLKLEFNAKKPINVNSLNSSLYVSCPIFGVGGFDKTGAGNLVLSGVNSYTGPTTISGGTVFVNSPGSLPAATSVTVNSGGALGGSGTVEGAVTVNAGGALAPGASVGTLTVNNDLTLSGDLRIEVNKLLSPSNDVIAVSGALTNAGTGTVTVENLGPPLAVGDRFTLFNQVLPNGGAMTVFSATGVIWTNLLEVDGSIEVVSVPAPVPPATDLTITPVAPNSFSVTGLGVADTTYRLLSSTNVALPMTSWSLVGITNSDGGGLIQFLHTPAAGGQRFYRIGYQVP